MTGARVALDTNIAIHYLNGNKLVSGRFDREDDVALPTTVAGELLFGAANSGRPEHNLPRYSEFVVNCEGVALDVETAQHYAELKLQLSRLGTPIPENDLWIAASCLQHDLVLVTADAHFSSCPGLHVENWLKPEPST